MTEKVEAPQERQAGDGDPIIEARLQAVNRTTALQRFDRLLSNCFFLEGLADAPGQATGALPLR